MEAAFSGQLLRPTPVDDRGIGGCFFFAWLLFCSLQHLQPVDTPWLYFCWCFACASCRSVAGVPWVRTYSAWVVFCQQRRWLPSWTHHQSGAGQIRLAEGCRTHFCQSCHSQVKLSLSEAIGMIIEDGRTCTQCSCDQECRHIDIRPCSLFAHTFDPCCLWADTPLLLILLVCAAAGAATAASHLAVRSMRMSHSCCQL